MNDALVSAQKHVNTEAKITIPYAKMMINRFPASALTYFVTKTSASYISCCVDIQAYLLQKEEDKYS